MKWLINRFIEFLRRDYPLWGPVGLFIWVLIYAFTACATVALCGLIVFGLINWFINEPLWFIAVMGPLSVLFGFVVFIYFVAVGDLIKEDKKVKNDD